MTRDGASPFSVGPRADGWELAWLESPGIVVCGIFDHVLCGDRWTDFEDINIAIRWPDEILEALLPPEKTWIVEVQKTFFRAIAGKRPWSPERRRLRAVGAQWQNLIGQRVRARLPAGLGEHRLKPFSLAITGPDQLVSIAFVPTAEVALSRVNQWSRRVNGRAAELLAGPCERMLALQDGHIFVATTYENRQVLRNCLYRIADKSSLPVAEGRTLRSSPIR